MSNSHLPYSSTSPADSIPYRAPSYSGEVIAQLKSEIMFVEHKYKELQEPDSFGLVDHAKVETEFYELLNKIEKQIGSKACPEGESNLWKELQFLLKNDPVNSSNHWMSFHQISEFRDSIYSPETRSTEQIIAEYESKLRGLLQTWQDYTGSAYPH